MIDSLQFAFLGGFQITRDNVPVSGFISGKAQALLCYLAVTGRPHLRPALAGLLWGDMPQDKANTNLRKALSNLRKLVPAYLCFTNQSVSFDRSAKYDLDVEAFARQVEVTLDRDGNPLAPESVAALTRAVDRYQGDFLAGFYVRGALDFEEWVLAERERLRMLALRALRALVNYHAARAENPLAIEYAARLLALEPWCEEIHRQMMLLLARSGRPSAALAQYETCCRVLAKELGVAPMAETTALYERIQAASSRIVSLPVQPTPFVGREDVLARVTRCLGDPACRLLTLVGPGGIGKTRLALQVATIWQQAFLDGVFFVPLIGSSSPDLLLPAIAGALHFSFYSRQDPKAQLFAYLGEKELLLVLDNFEQVLEEAGLLSEMLEHVPRIRLLVTSRQRLALRWEWILDVGGMAYPEAEAADPIAQYGAVRLFAQTAGRVHAGFSLAAEAQYVARICRLVEGMPLAIELAAAGVRTRSCEQIARKVARNLDLLATSLRDVPARHRSVHAVFEDAWRLLAQKERDVLLKLAVFRGGFEVDAARLVAGATRLLLDVLIGKSLLRQAAGGRYEMHELLRQYAEEKLAASPQVLAETRRLHSRYYATFLQRREKALCTEKQKEALEAIGGEIENVRAAWRQAITGRQIETIARALEGFYRFLNTRGWFQEGREAFARAAAELAGVADARRLLGRVLARQGGFCFRLGAYDKACELAEKSLALLERTDDGREVAFAHSVLGTVAEEQGSYEKAQKAYETSLALYGEAGDSWGMARVFDHLGDLARMVGEYDRAQQCYEQCLALCRECGDRLGLAGAYNNLGSAAGTRGDYDQARTYFESSLAIRREMEDRFGVAGASHNLSTVAFLQGEYQAARQLRRETLSICRQIGFRWGVANSQRHLGDVHRQLGEYAEAQRLYQESLALEREIGHRRGVALLLSSLGSLARIAGQDEQAWPYYRQALQVAMEIASPPVVLSILISLAELLIQEKEQERALSLLYFIWHHSAAEQQTRDQAARLFSGLEAQFPRQVISAIQAKAKTQTLENVVARLV